MYQNRNAVSILNLVSNIAYLRLSDFCSQLFSLLLCCLQLALQSLQTSRNVAAAAFQLSSQTVHHFLGSIYMSHSTMTGNSLNTAHACTAGAFANDFEHTDLSSIAYMAATAEFHGEVRNGNNTNNIAVFFTEESSSTLLLSFLNRQLFNINSFAS